MAPNKESCRKSKGLSEFWEWSNRWNNVFRTFGSTWA